MMKRVAGFIWFSMTFIHVFAQGDYPYQPVNFSLICINDHFWKSRQEVNRTATIPFAFNKCKITGRLENFNEAGRVNKGEVVKGKFCSKYGYDDSDVFKIIEGAAYSLTTNYDPKLDGYLDSLIATIASAQEKDGYLYTMRTIDPDKSWARERWVNDRTRSSHELYNVGHMYEAAVAHYQATGKRTLLEVAIKNADLLCDTFGPDKMHTAPGHQEIEIGLAKLYRVTGKPEYLQLARFFLDERGKGDSIGGEYNQDHMPILEQKEAIGHAVRAVYMYSAMADIAALTQDPSYIRAIDRIWENVVTKKIYITGGIGANKEWEAFGQNYELPNLTAYNETCAAIANVFWNYRMFLLHGDGKYMDVLERCLYNGLISGVSLEGTTFFYPNPLESSGGYKRSEWFGCSCCPSNVTRFISSVSQYIYARRADTLFINLFIGSKGDIELNGTRIEILQETDYPWEGSVKFQLNPEKPARFTIGIRIPGWTSDQPLPGGLYQFTDKSLEKAKITVNRKELSLIIRRGYAMIDGIWNPGDQLTLDLPMPVRRVIAREEVTADRGRECIVKGPLVFCAEGIDNEGNLKDYLLSETSKYTTHFEPALLNGIDMIEVNATLIEGKGGQKQEKKTKVSLKVIPYFSWCNRIPGTMMVWFPVEP